MAGAKWRGTGGRPSREDWGRGRGETIAGALQRWGDSSPAVGGPMSVCLDSLFPEDAPAPGGRTSGHGGLRLPGLCEREGRTRGCSVRPPWDLQTFLQGEGGEDTRFGVTAGLQREAIVKEVLGGDLSLWHGHIIPPSVIFTVGEEARRMRPSPPPPLRRRTGLPAGVWPGWGAGLGKWPFIGAPGMAVMDTTLYQALMKIIVIMKQEGNWFPWRGELGCK